MKNATNKQILMALRLEVKELKSLVKELARDRLNVNSSESVHSDLAVGGLILATFVPKINKQIMVRSDVSINDEERETLVTQVVMNNEKLFSDKAEIVISNGQTFVKQLEGKVLQINTKDKDFKSTMLNSIYFDTVSNEIVAEFKKTGKRYKYFPKNVTNEEWSEKVGQLMDSEFIGKFFRNEFICKDYIGYQEL